MHTPWSFGIKWVSDWQWNLQDLCCGWEGSESSWMSNRSLQSQPQTSIVVVIGHFCTQTEPLILAMLPPQSFSFVHSKLSHFPGNQYCKFSQLIN